MQFISFCNSWILLEFKESIWNFDQFSPRNCVECWALKSRQFFHFIEAFIMNITKIPICFNTCSWRSWWTRRSRSSPWWARLISLCDSGSFHSTFEYFSCHNRPRTRIVKSLLDNQRKTCSLSSRRIQICSLSELWLRVSRAFLNLWFKLFHYGSPRSMTDWRTTTTDWTTNLRHESDKLICGAHHLLASEWTVAKIALSGWYHRLVPRRTSTRMSPVSSWKIISEVSV